MLAAQNRIIFMFLFPSYALFLFCRRYFLYLLSFHIVPRRAVNFITAVSTLVDCASSGLMARSAMIEGTSSAEMLDDLVFYLELGVLVGKSRMEGFSDVV